MTPWVIAMSHYPLYTSQLADDPADAYASGPLSDKAWLNAEECEFCGHCRECDPPGWAPAVASDATLGDARSDLEPLFYEFGVDIYWAGHVHYYQTFDGPLYAGALVGDAPPGASAYDNPPGVLHVCSGNGGPPSPSSCDGLADRNCIAQPYSYTRLVAHNATDLSWVQISNADGSVIDEWTVHQEKHGPFPVPAAASRA